jgi:predicted lipoprotein
MRKLSTVLPFALLFFCGLAQAQESDRSPPPPLDPAKVRVVMEKAVDDFIRPGYRDFLTSAKALEASMAALCAKPSSQTFDASNAAFGDAVKAWSNIEILRIGPVLEQNRFERILYYPDRKGLGLKQVQKYLSDKDKAVTSAESLKGKSVAAQGFGALEFVLSGSGSQTLTQENNSFRCLYGAAIAGNIAGVAKELSDAWETPEGARAYWTNPGPDNPVFRDEREAITALLGVLVHASETTRDQRIETFYKGPDRPVFPRTAIYWRSGLTWQSISTNLAAVQNLLHISGMAELLPSDQRSIIGSMDFVANSMIRVAGSLDSNIEAVLKNDTQRGKVNYLLVNGRDLISRLNDQYGGAIGLSSGFSFSDGD